MTYDTVDFVNVLSLVGMLMKLSAVKGSFTYNTTSTKIDVLGRMEPMDVWASGVALHYDKHLKT